MFPIWGQIGTHSHSVQTGAIDGLYYYGSTMFIFGADSERACTRLGMIGYHWWTILLSLARTYSVWKIFCYFDFVNFFRFCSLKEKSTVGDIELGYRVSK